MKRAIERELLVPLAEGMNAYSQDVPLSAAADVEAEDGNQRLRVTVKAIAGGAGVPVPTGAGGDTAAADPARRSIALRRDLQRLGRTPVVLALHNDLYELRRLRERLVKLQMRKARARQRKEGGEVKKQPLTTAPHVGPENEPRLARLARLEPVAEAIRALEAKVVAMENELLLRLYEQSSAEQGAVDPSPSRATSDKTPTAESSSAPHPSSAFSIQQSAFLLEWDDLLLSLYVLRFPKPDHVILSVYGADPQLLFELAAAYRRLAVDAGGATDLYRFELDETEGRGDEAKILRYKVEKPEQFLADPHAEALGLTLAVAGKNAFARFAPEQGLHAFQRDKQVFAECWVDTTDEPLAGHRPRMPLDQREAIGKAGKGRRVYDLDKGEARDSELSDSLRWVGRNWEQAIGQGMDGYLKKAEQAMLGRRE